MKFLSIKFVPLCEDHKEHFDEPLVVPSWSVLSLARLDESYCQQALPKPFDDYWMKSAYRIPKGKFPEEIQGHWPTQETQDKVPITELVVNSLVTNIQEGQRFKQGAPIEVRGLAWDGGHGIKMVEISTDGGRSWSPSALGKSFGDFSWRRFTYQFKSNIRGKLVILARATNGMGRVQSDELIQNPGGYHNNKIEELMVSVE